MTLLGASMEFNAEFVEPGQGETPRKVLNTQGYWVETDLGRMIELMSGNTSYIWGYGHPGLIGAINNQLHSVQFVRAKSTETADIIESVNKDLMAISGTTGITWAVSGSDGVEAGVEMALKYWEKTNPNKSKILSFSPGYHGCTALGKALRGIRPSNEIVISAAPQWLLEKDQRVNEVKCFRQLNQTIKQNPQIGTIIMESIPWVEGVHPWSQWWWENIRKLCDINDILLVIDDVFGGFGKVSGMVSHKEFNVQPDIVVLGKAITGGYVPLSCALSSDKVTQVLSGTEWMHGHTWQPQMLGIACVRWVLDNFDLVKVNEIHQRQCDILDKLKRQRLIREYHGTGLTKEVILWRPTSKMELQKQGLCNNQYAYLWDTATNTMGALRLLIVTPLIADEEYWTEFESRISRLTLPYVFYESEDLIHGCLPVTPIT